jgi:K+-sensing histidine kinase KdpD
MRRRIVVALRPVSPVERLLKVGAALCRRLEAELEVLADPTRPDWADIEARLAALEADGVDCRLTPAAGLDAKRVVEHARSHECVTSVVVGRPAAWAGDSHGDPWSKLECPLVAASDSPDLPEEN